MVQFATHILSKLTSPQYAQTLLGFVEQVSWFQCDDCNQWRILKDGASVSEGNMTCADAAEPEDKQYVMKPGDVSVCVIVCVYDMT